VMFVSLKDRGDSTPEQGSDEWFRFRRGRMTGSKPSSMCFSWSPWEPAEVINIKRCDNRSILDVVFEDGVRTKAFRKRCPQFGATIKVKKPATKESWQKQWDIVFSGDKEAFDDNALARMAWGSKHEDSCVKTLLNVFPTSIFYEIPCLTHPLYKWIAASPDGLMTLDGVKYNVEIKCPFSGVYEYDADAPLRNSFKMIKKLKTKKTPPYYYMTQIHFEMTMQRVSKTIFAMWVPGHMRLWKMEFDPVYWAITLDALDAFYKRIVPVKVLDQKMNRWINMSQSYANKCKVWKDIPFESSDQ